MRAQITMAAKDGDPPTWISHLNVHSPLRDIALPVGENSCNKKFSTQWVVNLGMDWKHATRRVVI